MAESMKGLKRTARCAEFSSADIGKTVTVMGWVQKSRNKGGLVFTDLRDRSGILQIIFEEDICGSQVFEKAGTLRSEYCIAVVGNIRSRGKDINKELATGEIEVEAKELRILSESAVLPFPIEAETKTREELRLKYRYLDLRRPPLQRNIALRSKLAISVRNYMTENGFLEIETPTFIKSTPEGARDYLVPSRVHQGEFYALPQSPQLLKQLLMVSGFDRYFQLARCYRDEDLRADRQPEFTQIDMELSFADIDDVIAVNEGLLKRIFKEVIDVDVELPIRRMTWQTAMDRYGCDKPDLRFGLEIEDVSECVKDCGFSVFHDAVAEGGTVRGIRVPGQGHMPRKKIDALTEVAKYYGGKGIAYICVNAAEDGSHKSSFAKFMTEAELNSLISRMGGESGDLLVFAAGKIETVRTVLCNVRLTLGKELGLIKEGDWKFVWITEFPLFEWSEEEGRFMAMHHPFTAPMEEDWQYIDTDPGRVRAKAYDIVLNGTELGGGSVRIHQADVQEKMLEKLGFTEERAQEQFGFLLEAFKYGVPPHAGLAYGMDRVAMWMAGAESIRDVMAFPKLKDASDAMMGAPAKVEDSQLKELGIMVDEEAIKASLKKEDE
ncbi:MAG TPA: aspartate--tRNA ligase [Candidatus Avilachnospira avicola]|nr:aspartate--tRNA ligase [Candidatus Avilachnospira avicola]